MLEAIMPGFEKMNYYDRLTNALQLMLARLMICILESPRLDDMKEIDDRLASSHKFELPNQLALDLLERFLS